MKKNLFAIALAATMALTPMAAFAGETEGAEVPTLDYNNIDESVYDGTWISTVFGFDLYLPTDWNVLVNGDQVDDSVKDQVEGSGLVFLAQEPEDSNGDGVLWTVGVTASETDITSLDQAEEQIAAIDGAENVMEVSCNGIPAVTFDLKNEKASGVAFGNTDGQFFTLQISPNDDDDFTPTALNIFNSLSPTEAEASTEVEETEAE